MALADHLTVAVPTGLVVWAAKMIPPYIGFGSPVQRAQDEAEAFWHVPISIDPGWWCHRLGPATVGPCSVYADLEKGGVITNHIRLGFGDFYFGGCHGEAVMRRDHMLLVPIIWRSEKTEDRKAYIADMRFLEDQGDRHYPIGTTDKKVKFHLRITCGKFAASSPHKYLIKVPQASSNGHFQVEQEFEGEGSTGA